VWVDHVEQNVNKTYEANKDAVFEKEQSTSFHGRFVRVIPTNWHDGICIKVQLKGCKVCSAPLGMDDGRITNSQIKTSPRSSTYRNSPRLNNVRYFIASITWFPFIQVDFGPSRKRITAIAAQGGHRSYNTWTYYVKYMDDGDDWFNYAENGVARIFEGGEDMDIVAKHYFSRNLTTRFIRVIPLTWSLDACIRIELYGCSVCEEALGIEEGLFNMTASSHKEPGYEPWRGRLRGSGIWRSRTNNAWEFLQVSFDHVMDITGIATEGHDATCGKTRRFYLYYSLDGLRFHQYIDPFVGDQVRGNEANDKAIFIKLGYVIRARHVRIRPISYTGNKCLRIELYGCPASGVRGVQSLGFEAGKIANCSLRASSTLNRFHKPSFGRLNTVIEGGAWCARVTNTSQYFQVDLHEVHKLTNIILQGKYSGSTEEQGWVTKFSVTYSNDGIVWNQHVEDGLKVSAISFTS